MIENNYTVKKQELKKFKPVPLDKYQVQVTDVNLITALNNFSGVEEELLNFEFTILDKKDFDFEQDGEQVIETTRGRRLWKRIRPVLSAGGKNSKASWMYKLLCAVEKKELTAEELSEFDPNTLVGQQVIAFVEVVKEYNNITGFGPIKEEMPAVDNAADRVAMENVEPEEVEEKKDTVVDTVVDTRKVEDVEDKELPF